MNFPRRTFLRLAMAAAALPAVPRIARAQAYPSRPVRIIVGFPAGGATDIQARLMGQWLSDRLGQQFIVENRPGASGNIGTEAVARAPADGYTLLQIVTPHAINAALYTNLNFDFVRDIAPIICVARLAYGGLADAVEEGARIASALTDGVTVILMDNHGVLVVGESVADAWHQLYFLERACQVQLLAQSTGSPLLRVPEDVAAHTAAQFRAVGGQSELFAAVRRELDRVNPGYER